MTAPTQARNGFIDNPTFKRSFHYATRGGVKSGPMPMLRAIVSRRFSWRLMLLGVAIGALVGPLAMGWRNYPWEALPLVVLAIVVLHPVMDKDVPDLIGPDMLRSPRTYVAVALCIACEWIFARHDPSRLQPLRMLLDRLSRH
jgi:hypothetical protein